MCAMFIAMCCFLVIRRPPRSTRTDTLFPSTTLVRSLEVQCLVVERDTLGALGIEHRLALLEPELAVLGPLGRRKILEHVLIIDDTILKNLDKGRAFVRVGRLPHGRQFLRPVEAARAEARARSQCEGWRLDRKRVEVAKVVEVRVEVG